MKLSRAEREAIAAKRLRVNLRAHGIANARTLEQKISDAGPYGQRIDPHVLTDVRKSLEKSGEILRVVSNIPWFHLADANADHVSARLAAQSALYNNLQAGNLRVRLGQSLEIATYRSLLTGPLQEFHGRFRDLDQHDDSTLYVKEEPPQHIGARALDGQQRLDFIVRHPEAGYLGLECKNTRVWLYPHDEDVKETLAKCLALDIVPVIIARRIPYVTFMLLTTCGVILHQTYNQLLPSTEAGLADQARDKHLLAYHDIRLGNFPDGRMGKFISQNLPAIAADARSKFDAYKDLLLDFASGDMPYAEFAARVRRRSNGEPEDWDVENPPFDPDEWDG